MNYPDYVKKYRPKGTIVKKVKDSYYAYYATSKRVEGKKYPVQVVKGLAGKIERDGFHPSEKARVDTEHVKIRECGFTNYLLLFEKEYITHHPGKRKQDAKSIYRSLIVYLSNNSWLDDDESFTHYTIEELVEKYGIGIPNQVTAIEKICEQKLSELEALKYICTVKAGEKFLHSELTKEQKRIMEKIGVREDDIRGRIRPDHTYETGRDRRSEKQEGNPL